MKHLLKFTPEFILCGYILIFLFFKHPGENWDRSINSDGKGYYAYLPAIFIYHDLTYKFIESYEAKYYPPDRSVFKEFRIQSDGKNVNKCFPGLAILWLPFFLIAHLLSYFFDFQMDGYSQLYQYAISVAALFYLWLGCRFLMILLHKAGNSLSVAALITFVVAAGTNIMFYTIVEDSMSHVYSFALVTVFLYCSFRYFQSHNGKYFITSAIILGLIILVRPTNIMILLLLPLMAWIAAGSPSPIHGEGGIRTLIKYGPLGLAILGILLSIPFVIWRITTGHWFVYQYGAERFHFLHPHIPGILFSYNRGWFLYTPVAFVSMFGFIHLWKQNRTVFIFTLSFFLIFVYISSCWWMWYYSSKFGQRVFADIYAFSGIMMLFLFLSLKKIKWLRNTLVFFVLMLTGFSVFQTYQHSAFIFPATDLTSEIYHDSFMRIHPVAKVYLPAEGIVNTSSFFTDMENPKGLENPWTITRPFGTSGTHCSFITHKHPYSVGKEVILNPLFTTPNRIIRVNAMVFSPDTVSRSTMVVEVRSGEQKLSYGAFYLARFVQAGTWTPVEAAFYVPRGIPDDSRAKIYFFNNRDSAPLFIDDLKIDFLSLKDEQQYIMMEGVQYPGK